jgi:tetratricopeptide (TPR) repeat protein
MIDRTSLIGLIHASQAAGRHDFARAAAADWLAAWPGDTEVQFLLAQTDQALGHADIATGRLAGLIVADPEYTDAYQTLAATLRSTGDPVRARVFAACAMAVRGVEPDPTSSPSWTVALSRSVLSLSHDDPAAAVEFATQALGADPDLPAPLLLAARAHLATGDKKAAFGLARAGLDRWPECVMFRLLCAMDLLEQGETSRAVEYLHRVAADDPTGRISGPLLGEEHPYLSLWPSIMAAQLSRPIPAEVAAVTGDNRLGGAPGPGSAQSASPAPATTAAPVENSAAERTASATAAAPAETEADVNGPADGAVAPESPASGEPQVPDDGPTPLPGESFRGPDPGNSKKGAGIREPESLADIREEFDRMARRVRARRAAQDEDGRLPAYIVLSNRTRLIQQFGQDRFSRIDEAIVSLVQAVRRRRGWTAYRVYTDDPTTLQPFALTPADPANPWQIKLRVAYATVDENYFVPEWPVGRLPVDTDADLLVRQLRAATDDHLMAALPTDPLGRLRGWLVRVFSLQSKAFGYSASIWRRSSMAVFRLIGEPRSLLTSPPVEAGALPVQATRPVRLSYFNLHGVEDAAEWFGQRDPLRDPPGSVDFPVALRPQDVVNGGRAPRIVFTEACYGANALGKSAETALCLKFLDSGTRAVIGSTKVSYGSVTPPLIGADLLGRLFWENTGQSLPAGEALRRGKLSLAAEMLRRQGFLDGEDQKTLISFVLYGDPLYSPDAGPGKPSAKAVIRRTGRPGQVKTACALGGPARTTDDLDPATSGKVRAIVAQYLPGMAGAVTRVHSQHCGCEGKDHTCPSHQLGVKGILPKGRETVVVTMSKQFPEGDRRHAHFVRLTLDSTGKVLKLAVSR